MNTTADYLNQLEQDREDLVDNLETKGITGLTGDETFTELVPEVLNIPSGGGSANLQSKSVSITSNGTTMVVPDTGYDGLSDVEINTNIMVVIKNAAVPLKFMVFLISVTSSFLFLK